MSQRLIFMFDGEVLHPEQPLDLAPNTRVAAMIEELRDERAQRRTGRPLRVFDIGDHEVGDEDLYPQPEETSLE